MPEIPTLIIISDPNMGDSICAMHAVQVIAAQRKEVYLSSLNREVELLMKPAHVKAMAEIPQSGLLHVKHLSINNAFRLWGRNLGTPEEHYLREAGCIVPGQALPKAKIDLLEHFNYQTQTFEKPDVPQADIVIAPWTQDHGRLWEWGPWADVIRDLRVAGRHITVVGGRHDPKPWHWNDVDYYYGQPLSSVGYMLREANAVLTIDSGPSRLAQVVGANHIVLSPSIYPERWVAEPQSFQVRSIGPVPEWNVNEVVDAVLQRVRPRHTLSPVQGLG